MLLWLQALHMAKHNFPYIEGEDITLNIYIRHLYIYGCDFYGIQYNYNDVCFLNFITEECTFKLTSMFILHLQGNIETTH